MPTKQELELLGFSDLAVRLKHVAENRYSSSLEADQARELLDDLTSDRYRDIKDRPALDGRTVGEFQDESLKRRVVDFLTATQGRWAGNNFMI